MTSNLQSYAEVCGLYMRAAENIAQLRSFKKINVCFNVDGTNLKQTLPPNCQIKYDVIVWNFPHCGLEDSRLNCNLIGFFFYSACEFLKPNGEIQITLCNGQFRRWGLHLLSFSIRESLTSYCALPFERSLYPGYHTKRTHNGM